MLGTKTKIVFPILVTLSKSPCLGLFPWWENTQYPSSSHFFALVLVTTVSKVFCAPFGIFLAAFLGFLFSS